jgi:hypothetical protein
LAEQAAANDRQRSNDRKKSANQFVPEFAAFSQVGRGGECLTTNRYPFMLNL